ncbi:MAG: hypothetical protein NUV75_13485 [Gallionella sp.]|nr:hypothetical protein [Gallionella sp.]
MSVKDPVLTVGFDKNGEAEFGVRCTVCDLTSEKMKELRAMISVAIGIMEKMWFEEQMRKPENACADATVRRAQV